MDIFGLHQRFSTLHNQQSFPSADWHLYFYLVGLFNSKGQGNKWPESIQLTDGVLSLSAGMDPKTLGKARDRLVSRGLISAEGGGQGSRSGIIYKLLTSGMTSGKNTKVKPATSGTTSVKIPEVNTEVSTEVDPDTSGKNTEVNAPPPPELREPLREEHPENLPKSIYKVVQTPDTRHQTVFPDASSDAQEKIEEMVSDFEAKKNAGGPTPQPPAPPRLFPTGKVYGDGELQADVEDYYAKFPDQFPREIATGFARYWTGTKHKDRPDLNGMEKWRTRDTWVIETRLDNWNQIEQKPKHGNAQTTTAAFFDHQRATEPQSGNNYGKF